MLENEMPSGLPTTNEKVMIGVRKIAVGRCHRRNVNEDEVMIGEEDARRR